MMGGNITLQTQWSEKRGRSMLWKYVIELIARLRVVVSAF